MPQPSKHSATALLTATRSGQAGPRLPRFPVTAPVQLPGQVVSPPWVPTPTSECRGSTGAVVAKGPLPCRRPLKGSGDDSDDRGPGTEALRRAGSKEALWLATDATPPISEQWSVRPPSRGSQASTAPRPPSTPSPWLLDVEMDNEDAQLRRSAEVVPETDDARDKFAEEWEKLVEEQLLKGRPARPESAGSRSSFAGRVSRPGSGRRQQTRPGSGRRRPDEECPWNRSASHGSAMGGVGVDSGFAGTIDAATDRPSSAGRMRTVPGLPEPRLLRPAPADPPPLLYSSAQQRQILLDVFRAEDLKLKEEKEAKARRKELREQRLREAAAGPAMPPQPAAEGPTSAAQADPGPADASAKRGLFGGAWRLKRPPLLGARSRSASEKNGSSWSWASRMPRVRLRRSRVSRAADAGHPPEGKDAGKPQQRTLTEADKSQVAALVRQMEETLDRARILPIHERKKAFRELQRLLHPDKNRSCQEAAKIAFQMLMDRRGSFLRD